MFGHSGHGLLAARCRAAATAARADERARALAMRRAEAIGAGVAAADDDHVLVFRGDGPGIVQPGTSSPSQRRFDSVRYSIAKWMPFELAAGHRQIARRRGAAREHDRVVVAPQLVDRHVDADVAAGLELDAFVAHQRQAAVEKPLLHLECGNPVPQQAADAVRALEHRDEVARPVQLIGRGEAGRPGSDDRDALAGADDRRTRGHPAFVERALDDRHLDRLDRHRIVVDAEHARSLARRGQSRPVNSGKLFVACSRSMAACQRSR